SADSSDLFGCQGRRVAVGRRGVPAAGPHILHVLAGVAQGQGTRADARWVVAAVEGHAAGRGGGIGRFPCCPVGSVDPTPVLNRAVALLIPASGPHPTGPRLVDLRPEAANLATTTAPVAAGRRTELCHPPRRIGEPLDERAAAHKTATLSGHSDHPPG